jgi:outer membrane lipoprotein carrier protein
MNSLLCRTVFAGLILLLLVPPVAHAEKSPDSVQSFFRDLQTLQADFDQQVIDANNKTIQSSQGHMWIRRPGRFRWDYITPYRQQLIADGEHLWSYDEDLEQVTVQPAAEVLTSTPAMLLSGDQPLEKVFLIEAVEMSDDKQHVRLIPRSDDSNVIELQLFFSGGMLARIEAQDSFGNTTIFSFTQLVRNPKLDQDVFSFTPPAGADVVGDLQ